MTELRDSQDELLEAFLESAEIDCPACGARLGAAPAGKCPACGVALRLEALATGVKRPMARWLFLTIVGLGLGLGAALSLIGIQLIGMHGQAVRLSNAVGESWPMLLVGIGCGAGLLMMLIRRRDLTTRSESMQRRRAITTFCACIAAIVVAFVLAWFF